MNSRDPKGYYAKLGVEPSASAREIKIAFRRLAKIHHPDRHSAQNATDEFRAIVEAYEVLSDPARRATYDNSAYVKASDKPRRATMAALRCSKCGNITAQPRYVIFRHVVSVVLVTITTPVQGLYCSSCARKLAFKASCISAIGGWWGFPWGPILTITNIIRNAFGGTKAPSEEKLLWYNAVAFYSQGNFVLAHALARKVRMARDETIATDALRLIDQLHSLGVPKDAPPLANPWRLKLSDMLRHSAVAFAVPLLFIYTVFQSTTPRGAASFSAKPFVNSIPVSQPEKKTTVWNPSPVPVNTKIDFDKLTPQCSTPPWNGKVLDGYAAKGASGHEVEIKNGSSADAIVKLRDAVSGRLAVSFFVQKGATATFGRLPDGTYHVQYAFGSNLAVDCRSFAHVTSAQQMPSVESMVTRYSQTKIIRSHLTYTLYTVPGGNVRPEYFDPTLFEAE